MKIAGLIYAGGKSSRFGCLKENAMLGGRTLLSHVVSRAAPQVEILAISRAENSESALPVVVDKVADCGPLGGLHAGLCWANALTPKADFLATFACDTPLIPDDLVARLLDAATGSGAAAAIASTGGQFQPTLGLWSTALEPLAEQRLSAGAYSLHAMAQAAGAVAASFDEQGAAVFFNVNEQADLASLEEILKASPR